MSAIEETRFQAFINHIGAQPDVSSRVRLMLNGFLQLLRERADAAAKTGVDGAHLVPFADMTNILDKFEGPLQTAVVSGAPNVRADMAPLFPGDLGYMVDQPSNAGEGHYVLHDLWVVEEPAQAWDPAKVPDLYTEAGADVVVKSRLPVVVKKVRFTDVLATYHSAESHEAPVIEPKPLT